MITMVPGVSYMKERFSLSEEPMLRAYTPYVLAVFYTALFSTLFEALATVFGVYGSAVLMMVLAGFLLAWGWLCAMVRVPQLLKDLRVLGCRLLGCDD